MSPSFVLTALRRHWALTVSRRAQTVSALGAHRLAPVHKRTRIILRVVNLVIPHIAYPAGGKEAAIFEHPVKDDH